LLGFGFGFGFGLALGLGLVETPSLQYLCYLRQVGISMSPIANNALCLQLAKNPFDEFFAVGL
jgi:AMP deaminase